MVAWAFLDQPPPLAIAHRGGSLEAPENTLAAFAHAVALGYRYVELDLRTTRDGVLAVFHDATLARVTGRPGTLASLEWAEITEARVLGAEPIPRFADVLERWPDLRVVAELKDDAGVVALARLLAERDAFDRVCVASFSDARLARTRALTGGRARTSVGERGALRLGLGARGLPLGRPPGTCVQVPPSRRGLRVDRRFVEHCHRLGLAVHVWTVDEPAEMERLLRLGVDGLMTDRPAVLRRLLIARGEWR